MALENLSAFPMPLLLIQPETHKKKKSLRRKNGLCPKKTQIERYYSFLDHRSLFLRKAFSAFESFLQVIVAVLSERPIDFQEKQTLSAAGIAKQYR